MELWDPHVGGVLCRCHALRRYDEQPGQRKGRYRLELLNGLNGMFTLPDTETGTETETDTDADKLTQNSMICFGAGVCVV